jgi:2-methylaconitate cis-trans-isomerase PrpF
LESGDFELDGCRFPSCEIKLEFLDPGKPSGATRSETLFPTGNKIDILQIPGIGLVSTTLLNAGNPTVFISADVVGLNGTESQSESTLRTNYWLDLKLFALTRLLLWVW